MKNKHTTTSPEGLESAVRRRGKRNLMRDVLLTTIAAVPLLTVAMAAPKVLSLLKDEHIDYIIPRDPKQRLRENAARLKNKGLITFEERHGRKFLRLTKAGEQQLSRIRHRGKTLLKPRRWDEKWRIVIFDIPEIIKMQLQR